MSDDLGSGAASCHPSRMSNLSDIAGGVHIVRVHMDSGVGQNPTVQLWLAVLPREEAEAAVQAAIPAGWRAELTDRRLTKEEAGRQNLRYGDVKELSS